MSMQTTFFDKRSGPFDIMLWSLTLKQNERVRNCSAFPGPNYWSKDINLNTAAIIVHNYWK